MMALHYDMGFLAQRNGLRDHVHSSHHNSDFDRDEGTQSFKCLGNLVGKFASRCETETEQR